jgi:hypothetical protein
MYIMQQVAVAKDGRILAAYAVDAKALPEREYTKVAAQFSLPVSVAGNFDILVLFEGDGGVVAHRERDRRHHIGQLFQCSRRVCRIRLAL